MNKKAQTFQLQQIIPFVIIIIIISMVLAFGALTLGKIRDKTPVYTIAVPINDSFSFANNSAQTLTHARIINGTEQVYNGTNLLNAGRNYSIDYGAATITFFNETPREWFNDSATNGINVSYSYLSDSGERNATVSGLSGLKTGSDFVPIAATVVIAAIIIGIMIGVMAFLMKRY